MRHLAVALLALVFSAGLAFSSGEDTMPDSSAITEGRVRVGDVAPDFKLTSVTGEVLRLHQLAPGKITVLVFWSYFCFPCQSEMPELQQFYNESKENVAIVAIAMDGPQYDNLVKPYIEENKLKMPIAYDRETDKFYETAEKYGVIGTPTFFILDDALKVRFIHLGKIDKALLKGMVESAKSKAYCAEIVKPALPAKKPEPCPPEGEKAEAK